LGAMKLMHLVTFSLIGKMCARVGIEKSRRYQFTKGACL
jgi:hypothetical protein